MASNFSPYPDQFVTYLGGKNIHPHTYYVLAKRGHILVVQVPCMPTRDVMYYMENPRALAVLEKQYYNVLETIQSIIETIDFELTNWAYLTPGAKGGYRLQQKRRTFPAVTCPLWAPVIREDEIKLKTFVELAHYRIGEWKGQEVDIYRGYNDNSFKHLNQMMENYRILEGMDLTFRVLGHLISDDGAVVGIVTEPAVGREITATDRSLVYNVVANLQKRGFLFLAILPNTMVISNGKLRVVHMENEVVRYYPPERRDELDKMAEKYHWRFLQTVFSEGEACWWPLFRKAPTQHMVFPKIISPERPYQVRLSLKYFYSLHSVQRQKEYGSLRYKGGAISVVLAQILGSSLKIKDNHEGDLDSDDKSIPGILLPTRDHASRHRCTPYRQISRRATVDNRDADSDITSNIGR
ncbi:hypothetical protein BDQ17DRAFT_1547733 [Cyathus striatus]|nr:hypothetical protein BDQ17DRAFT_1547733 [Cyathus striatus]